MLELLFGYRNGDEADSFPVPGIGDVEIAVSALNDCGIRVFAGLIFKGVEHFEVLSIGADGEVERRTVFGAVVVDENDASIAKTDSIDAGVGIENINRMGLRPCESVIE